MSWPKADETLAPDVRDRLGLWLEGISRGDGVRHWPDHFIVLFDRVFGHRHFSWVCFRRSGVATFLTTWVVGAWWIGAHPPDSAGVAAQALLLITVAGFVFSLIPDYLSLLETRLVLGRLSRGGSTFAWLLLDAVVTALLAGSVYLAFAGVNEGADRLLPTLRELATFRISSSVGNTVTEGGVITESVYAMPMAAFFYATFFTSAWLWTFAAASFVVRMLFTVLDRTARLRGLLDVREKPGRSLGLVAVVLVTMGYLGAFPLVLVVQSLR